jgi:VRR-NUC domain
MLTGDTANLLRTFDYWTPHSRRLREYLWAHRPDNVRRARAIVEILGAEAVRIILRYLLNDYWKRFCGWPDLLVHRDGEMFFAEVKASGDELSEDQKNWIRGNRQELKFPFKLIKIHRQGMVD